MVYEQARMLGLPLPDRLAELPQIVAVAGVQLPSALADFINKRIRVGFLLPAHGKSSCHSVSGVTIRGVKSPSRRLMTVR